jgi:REP-associated tyrosine transposase
MAPRLQKDLVHLIVMLAPKYKVSDLVSKIRILRMWPELRKQCYWGNHFWAEGYCVDTIGLDAEMILKYSKIPTG